MLRLPAPSASASATRLRASSSTTPSRRSVFIVAFGSRRTVAADAQNRSRPPDCVAAASTAASDSRTPSLIDALNFSIDLTRSTSVGSGCSLFASVGKALGLRFALSPVGSVHRDSRPVLRFAGFSRSDASCWRSPRSPSASSDACAASPALSGGCDRFARGLKFRMLAASLDAANLRACLYMGGATSPSYLAEPAPPGGAPARSVRSVSATTGPGPGPGGGLGE